MRVVYRYAASQANWNTKSIAGRMPATRTKFIYPLLHMQEPKITRFKWTMKAVFPLQNYIQVRQQPAMERFIWT
ncbi:hypothetical protein A2972_01635 [Candidatus Amesbacteria bacterium RIFCSPLOWO2_01_FULL_47_33]|uniref:Uncharacterized protein n=1 Tax=Candidatus Amesbacteria bacterium RIFCSPLOWO2_01_FULL_47_33 TaxID=1797258 RepID=A0A1F4Z3H2_9BACT|nr:MAG: hypothetical protein A2972_01635 [Candidatus Amesbacteria bacterium RIFCSPLOWO2_01_FULL_47_33]